MIKKYAETISSALEKLSFPNDLPGLYDPIEYTLAHGGKRLRPMLVLMAADLFSGVNEAAIQAALGVELFHNFTLIHDDVMDNAPLRRGHATVYKKWNQNTAILSGDALYAMACQHIARASRLAGPEIMDCFLATSVEVCEGQQLDMDFENMPSVDMEAYMRMIEYKTARLLACGLKLGALAAGAKVAEADVLYLYGNKVGMAFQLMDDYLDVFGEEEKFGKRKGGDILAGKKTYLYLHAMNTGNAGVQKVLREYYGNTEKGQSSVQMITEAFLSNGSGEALKEKVRGLISESESLLQGMDLHEKTKQELILLSKQLTDREI